MAHDGSFSVVIDADDKKAQEKLLDLKDQMKQMTAEQKQAEKDLAAAENNREKINANLLKQQQELANLEAKQAAAEKVREPLIQQAETLRAQMAEATAEVQRYEQAWWSGGGVADQHWTAAEERLAATQKEYSEILAKVDKENAAVASATEKVKQQGQAVKGVKDELARAKNAVDSAKEAAEGIAAALEKAKTEAGQVADRLAANKAMDEAKAQADKLLESIEKTEEAAQEAGDAGEEAADKTAAAIGKLEKRLLGLAKRVFVFSVITMALRSMRTWMSKAVKSNDQASAAIARLKGALLTLAQPILNVVIPAFIFLVNILTRVVSAIAAVVSALGGTTAKASAEAAESLYDEQNAIKGVGGAAKKAGKQLAAFDEIQKLNAEDAGGGGGGTASSITPLFDALKEFALPDWLDEFIGNLRLSVKDVFIEWENLTGEQIAKKVIAGLSALAGAVIGFSIGGVPGAIVGALTGAALGIVFDSLLFDNDGKLSKEEILKMIVAAAGALAGGVLGFIIGGPMGAAIGILIGAGLGVTISTLIFDNDGEISKGEILRLLVTALGALAGGVIGFIVGGPLGAAIGILVGAGVTLAISKVLIDGDGKFKLSGVEIITKFLDGIIEGLSDIPTWLREHVFTPIWDGILQVFGISGEKSEKLGILGGFISEGLLDGLSLSSGNTLLNYFWVVKHVFEPIWNLIKQVFGIASPSKEMQTLGGYIADGLMLGISDGITGQIEKVKDALNSIIDLVERAVNWIVDKINGFSITLPGINNPFTGESIFSGKTIGFNVPRIEIPRLAAGAVIPPNREFLAVLGDQRSGTNVEAPLSTIKQALSEALAESGGGDVYLTVQIGDEQILNRVISGINGRNRAAGRSVIRV